MRRVVLAALLPLAGCQFVLPALDPLGDASTKDAATAGDFATSNTVDAAPKIDSATALDATILPDLFACTTMSQCPTATLQFCVAGSCDPITGGLIAYWKFDEAMWLNDCKARPVIDSTGNGHDGASCPGSGQGPIPGMAGKFGNAATFDGSQQQISIAPDKVFDPGANDFSISAWVNLSDLTWENPIYDNFSDDFGHLWLIHRNGRGWSFEQRPHNSNTNTVILQQGNTTMSADTWTHVALVRSGNNWNIYLNGASVATANDNRSLMAGTGVQIGWGQDDFISVKGAIDDMRVYGRALTTDEVAAFSK